jgi:hypothetical protein
MGMTFPREWHMAIHIGRRDFITLLGGAGAAVDDAAQQRAKVRPSKDIRDDIATHSTSEYLGSW